MNALPSDEGPVVIVYSEGRKAARGQHEIETQLELARQIAALMGASFAGVFDPARQYPANRYMIPDDTLDSRDARRLNLASERDLYGGVVPFPFVATKVVVHGLPPGAREAPAGWVPAFGERVSAIVLPGFAAFTRDDAHAAASRLWRDGAVRLKRPSGIGGAGQAVVADRAALDAQLDDIGDAVLRAEGVVLERDLPDIETLSVGRLRLGDLEASYYGVQRPTTNNHGHQVYGGSGLVVVRGDFDALTRIDMPAEARKAIEQSRAFDEAVSETFDGFFASRRNYDVGHGTDAHGQAYCGVLEQSWRIGGASGAEIGALRAFRDDPAVRIVRASTTEVYGANAAVPADACVYYHGIDPQAGEITKYCTVDGERAR
ncbi:DUF3182 family protein [Caballeronia telluris]|uniref:Biotin carboxylase n=1 Tax=Caballeronia telluris TaxID=326475 RepID=A0A158FZ13_9BURK|nr:DUF3182 family protein [Caballeronia telluris]SAL24400.1 hypothetical protein AWB66_01360 [Caballeronia telluris]